MFTKIEVLKKLEAAKAKAMPELEERIRKVKKDIKDTRKDGAEPTYSLKALKRLESQRKNFKSVGGIPYRPRSGEFYTKQCGFNPETGRAHSYHWYDLGRIIKGVYVVNNYSYSMQTCYHLSMLLKTLDILGVRYIEIEAPRGLQDLESARDLYFRRIAELETGIKYGSAKHIKSRRDSIARARKQLETLKKLGLKFSEKRLEIFREAAEIDRKNKLKRDKIKRETALVAAYTKAKAIGDLKTLVKFHALNARRVKKGLPALAA